MPKPALLKDKDDDEDDFVSDDHDDDDDDFVGKDPKSQFLCAVPKTAMPCPSSNLCLHCSAIVKLKSYPQKQLLLENWIGQILGKTLSCLITMIIIIII